MASSSYWVTLDIQVDFDDIQPSVLEIVKRLRPSWGENNVVIEVITVLILNTITNKFSTVMSS